MDRDRTKSILANTLMFKDLESRQLDALVNIAELRTVPQDTTLCRQDQQPEGLYAIGAGQVKISRTISDGREYILSILEAGNTFAVVGTFGQSADMPMISAVTIVRSELVAISKDKLMPLLETDAKLCVAVLQGATVWLRNVISTLIDVVLHDALGRLSGYLVSRAQTAPVTEDGVVRVTLPVKKRDLASYLALTPETLSRMLGRLVELGAIRQDNGNEIHILSMNELKKLTLTP